MHAPSIRKQFETQEFKNSQSCKGRRVKDSFWTKLHAVECVIQSLTLSWWRSLSHRNQSIDLLCKSMDWFRYNKDLHHEWLSLIIEKFIKTITEDAWRWIINRKFKYHYVSDFYKYGVHKSINPNFCNLAD